MLCQGSHRVFISMSLSFYMVHVIKQNTTGKNVEVNAVKLYLISVIKAESVASLLQSSVDSCSPVTCDQ